ncbi:hypothetical protein [Methylobacterium dankookense]|uniref:hypothetical protein n=1 Tax=Methylobacterium dankookense TaxID=560405 RepID=UPI001643B31B|nr:hypothetical protein [Methylobacterium dankookense]
MRIPAPVARRPAWAWSAALALVLAAGQPARAAQLVLAKGAESGGYGRIALTFDKPVSVKAKVAGGVLLLSYGERSTASGERLADEMPSYVAMVRRDPDGTGLRIALQKPYRVNVQEAGEQVFVDLLPEGWSGLPPPLPPEVVAALARRAVAAEAALKQRNPPPARRTLAVELSHLPTLTRLSLRLPPGTRSETLREGAATRLRVAGPWSFDIAEARGRTKPALAALTAETEEGSASLVLTPAEGFAVAVEREDDAVLIDVAGPPKEPKESKEAKADQKADLASDRRGDPRPESGTDRKDARPAGEGRAQARPAPEPDAPLRQPGNGLVFTFRSLPPAALFERAGIATLAFETEENLLPQPGPDALKPLGEPRRAGPLLLVRFAVPPGRLLDLTPVATGSGAGWELAAGESLSPSEGLLAARQPGAEGRSAVTVDLPRPGSATWIDLDGARVAVVTSRPRRPAGIPKRQRFVDFELLPSRLGVAVLAGADDLSVRPDLDGVTIARDGGLLVSSVSRREEATLAEAGAPTIDREAWENAKRGNVRESLRALFAEAAQAPPGERGPLRMAHARALLANRLEVEALAALETASTDDPLLAAQRDTAILRGLALTRAGRFAEARKALTGDVLDRDPEAVLWRATAEAGDGAWRAAETGFRKTLALAERLPDDLYAEVMAAAAESAIETGDIDAAVTRLERAARRERKPEIKDRLALVKARVEELTGQTVAALDSYERLGRSPTLPVATAAALRHTLLALSTGALKPDAAIARLEGLGLTWHGGPIEEAIVAGLARSYAAAGRFREAFTATRRAAAVSPASETTRTLNAEAQGLFDDIYLAGRGDHLSGIAAVALYFDFKEFAPIGRRGDEIVRRLADRLVGLDLLDSAADLLQYQVDNRLTGPARSSVAARLATVRLMDGKPLQALQAIDATYLPELPAELRRARALIRARALSDLSRTDLALETIEDESGPEVARLRADILWAARRWRAAGEAHEALLGDVWRAGRPLDDAARADVIRAGIAYDLADERMGLERLKAKFSDTMAESADARTFALITGANPTRQPGFREVAQRASKAETLAAFLAEYRKRYPETAVPERGRPAAPAGEGPQSRAEASAGAPPG